MGCNGVFGYYRYLVLAEGLTSVAGYLLSDPLNKVSEFNGKPRAMCSIKAVHLQMREVKTACKHVRGAHE